MKMLGRKRPIARCPRLRFRNYLYRSLPPPPDMTSYWPLADAALKQMYLNDQLGDCVIAGIQHVEGVLTGNAGVPPMIFDVANTKRLYAAIGGYVDGDPDTDNGCDEQTALNYWVQNGLAADHSCKITGWAAVTGTDIDEIKTAIWLFENVIFGIEMPDDWIANNGPSGDGFIWDVAGPANENNGHCFVGVDYTSEGVLICSWGLKGLITWAAIAKYAVSSEFGELYTVLGPDAINKATQKAPSGFDNTQLIADLQSIRG